MKINYKVITGRFMLAIATAITGAYLGYAASFSMRGLFVGMIGLPLFLAWVAAGVGMVKGGE